MKRWQGRRDRGEAAADRHPGAALDDDPDLPPVPVRDLAAAIRRLGGRLWPKEPTLQNFALVFGEKHFYLEHFWLQLWNSLLIAVAVGAITLFVATARGVRDQPAEGAAAAAR